jgi:DNA-binding HxlR family transcriptional regulator
MAKDTRRDIAWNRTLTKILEKGTVRKNDLTKGEYGVSDRTATDVLSSMEGMNWIRRESVSGPKPDKWKRGEKLPATLSTEQP